MFIFKCYQWEQSFAPGLGIAALDGSYERQIKKLLFVCFCFLSSSRPKKTPQGQFCSISSYGQRPRTGLGALWASSWALSAGSGVEGIQWAPSQFSFRTFTWLSLTYILKYKLAQNHSMTSQKLCEFGFPYTTLGCGKIYFEILSKKDARDHT